MSGKGEVLQKPCQAIYPRSPQELRLPPALQVEDKEIEDTPNIKHSLYQQLLHDKRTDVVSNRTSVLSSQR
jgi:hypothetical protein